MRILGVIPSRWSSRRFPGKCVHPILGRPLVRWVVEAVQRAARLDEVIVAHDDERIARAVEGSGARAVMTDPNLPSGTDRVAAAAQAADDDIVVNIQGDEPLIDPALIDALVERMLEDRRWEMATAASPIRGIAELEDVTAVKVVLDREDGALYFSRLPIPFRRDGPPRFEHDLYLRHIGIYAYRGAFLRRLVAEPPCALERCEMLEQLRALHLGARIAVLRVDEAGGGVDKPGDVEYIETALKQRNLAAISGH